MAEERMLNDEILLGLIKANSGGGGGGTTDYSDLSNKPQIGGVTLSGNKSASDLGLATADEVEGKQDVLTAGDYIEIEGNEISVNPVMPDDEATYQIVSDGSDSGTYFVRINKIVDGEVVLTEQYSTRDNVKHTFDDTIVIDYANTVGWNFTYELLVDSTTHEAGYTYSWGYSSQIDVNEVVVIADHSGDKLVIKSEMDAALATKQNAEDNNLTTTSKQVVGAINEVNSNLTNLQEWTDADVKTVTGNPITVEDAAAVNAKALSMTVEPVQDLHGQSAPYVGGAGKNKLPLTVANLKTYNTSGTWSDNVYTVNGVTFTVNTDDGGNVIGIKASGTASAFTIMLVGVLDVSAGDKLNGCPAGGDTSRYCINTYNTALSEFYGRDTGDGLTFDSNINDVNVFLSIQNGYAIPTGGLTFYPMIRLATETDATFAPYTNICPIIGHTEASVETEGKNRLDGSSNVTQYNIDENGDTISGSDRLLSDYIMCDNNSNYTVGFNANMQFIEFAFYDRNKNFISISYNNNRATYTAQTPSNAKYMRIGVQKNSITTDGFITYQAMLVAGTTVADYAAYISHTATITFGETVYGGTVDFNTGKVRVTRAYLTENSFETMVDSTSSGGLHWVDVIVDAVTDPIVISNMVQTKTAAQGWSSTEPCVIQGAINASQSAVRVYCEETSLQDFKSAYDGLFIVYTLATPTTLQLTPAQLELLKGTNTITANGATISLTYQPDNLVGEVMEQVDEKIDEIPRLVNYSTTEQNTGQKWIDGGYIYTLSYVFENSITLPSNGDWIASGLAVSGIDSIVDSKLFRSNSKGVIDHSSRADSDGTVKIATKSINNVLNANSVLTIYYTKTTT